MDIATGQRAMLVRLEPGEVLHDAVCVAFELSERRFSTVVSCIGSLRHLEWGVAACTPEGIPGPGPRLSRTDQALEVGGISGHIGIDVEGQASPHLHGVIFGPDGECFGGHIHVAHVLITMEFALMGDPGVGWERFHAPVQGSGALPLLRPRSSRT